VAGETRVSQLPPEQKRMLAGALRPEFAAGLQSAPRAQALPKAAAALPATLDWRNYNGKSYVTSVKDQGNCGACWAFSTTAALESQMLITGNLNLDLSVETLLACSNAGDCNGGYPDLASDYIRDSGLPAAACLPYQDSDDPPPACANNCDYGNSKVYQISEWDYVVAVLESPTVSELKNALYAYGPIAAQMNAYDDLGNYVSGVYTHVSGDFIGLHEILIVGYDDTQNCFIVKNTWGTDWGEKGFFQIAYSEVTRAGGALHTLDHDFGDYAMAYHRYGSVMVDISPVGAVAAGAQWNVDNGAWMNSGATLSNLTVGRHTVAFKNITGWGVPSSQPATIAMGETISLNGAYLLPPPTVVSFRIDNGKATASSQTVTLNNTATSSPTQYMASQSSTFLDAAWQPYSASPGFTLSAGNGTKTVYFKVKNAAGASRVSSNTIVLAQLPTVTSFKIDGGAGSTTDRTVKLNNTATVSPTQYMASESPNFTGAAWLTYSTAPAFTLSAGNGTKKVYFKVKNTAGASQVVSDTIVLAQLPTVTSFKIDGGAASTTSRTATLNNTATVSPTQYMASESHDFTGAAWLTYSTAPAFTLSAGNGTKTVYFKVKNAAGASRVSSDTIALAQLPTVTSFKIDGGAGSTTSRTVTLNNTATVSPTQYMASESPNFTGAAWLTYSTAPAFTLSAGNGKKIVYFKVKNAAGASRGFSDSIVLAQLPTVTSFKINRGASSTSGRTVKLNNTATVSPTQYMASQSPTFLNAGWQPYSTSPSFTMSAGNGKKTVYFKVKNAAGASKVVNAAITLD